MARKTSPTLTDAELRPMEVLWQRGPSTVAEVVEALPAHVDLSYSTVLTTLRILEQKGYVRHTKNGSAFVYHAVIDRSQAQDRAVTHILKRFFNNSAPSLVLNLIESDQLNPKDLARIRKMIGKDQ
jgi:predicted transcriptional regulator